MLEGRTHRHGSDRRQSRRLTEQTTHKGSERDEITNLRRHVTVGPGSDHAHEPATGRVRAVWNGAVLAESHRTIVIEGNHYLPVRDVAFELLAPSDARSTCPWKGEASYLDVVIKGERNPVAAWSHPDPKPAGVQIGDSGRASRSTARPVRPARRPRRRRNPVRSRWRDGLVR